MSEYTECSSRDYCDDARAELTALKDRMEWQPIATAPLDGTEVLLIGTLDNMGYPKPERLVAAYTHGWWCNTHTVSHVTHWMPLPELPHD